MNKPQTAQHYTDQEKLARSEQHIALLQQAVRLLINRVIESKGHVPLGEMMVVQKAIRGEV